MKKLIATAVFTLIFIFGCQITYIAATYILGDVDGDEIVSIRDATEIQLYLVDSVVLTNEQTTAADVDGNGLVNIKDVTMIQMYLVNKIDKFPADTQTETAATQWLKDNEGYYNIVVKP